MKLIILDENLNRIDQFNFLRNSNNYALKQYKDVPDISESKKIVYNNLNYNVGIYAPTEKEDDFYISFLNNSYLNFSTYKLNEVKGALLSETFLPFNKKGTLLNKMIEVYKTNISEQFYFEYYDEKLLVKRYKVDIIRADDFIYIMGKDETEYNFISMKKNQFFEDYKEAISIIQDGHIVRCNKQYLKIQGHKSYDEVIGKEFGYTNVNKELFKRMTDTINDILEQRVYSYSLPYETKNKYGSTNYFNLNFNSILYNNQPAIMIVYNDITKEELNKKEIENKKEEDLFLQKTMNFIQKISDTGLIYTDQGKYVYSDKIYKVLEIENSPNDENRDIIKDMVIPEDKYVLEENYSRFEIDHKRRDFIIRVNTGNNNQKYLHCYLMENYKKSNNDILLYYQDITKDQLYLRNLNEALDESLRLKNNLEKIQTISKTAITYNNKGKLERTPSVFDLLKINYEEYKDHKDFFEFILKEDAHLWQNAYKKCSPESPESNTMFRIINGEGNIIYIKCYIKCNYDNKGNEISCVNFYKDVTNQITKENKLKEALENSQRLEQNFEKIEKISKTAIYYVNDIEKDDSIWYNKGTDSIELDPSKYIGNMSQYVIEEDKNIWKEKHALCTPKHPEISFIQRICTKGKIRYIQTYVAYQFDKKGNKISHTSLFQDITEDIERANELEKSLNEILKLRDNLNRIQSASKTYIIYKGADNYKIAPELFKILEIDPKEIIGLTPRNYDEYNVFIKKFILPEDLKNREEQLNSLGPENPEVKFIQRVKTDKENIKYIQTIIHEEYDDNGTLVNGVSYNQDITEETIYQKQLETALNDKKILLSEVHHRVKNNLQIILSLINLNINFDVDAETTLDNTQNHIYAMALIHEKIYGSTSLSEVDMKEYIESLVTALIELYESDIQYTSDIDQINLDMEQSIPLGLIINELVTNTIKYAFPNKKEGNLYIKFKKEKTQYILIFKDDGIGLPDDFDLDNLTSLGLIVVQNLTLQIGGTLSIIDCEGTGFKIEFEEI